MTGEPPATPFWRRKPLAQMSPAEWESLCDGCGKCCLHKIEDAQTGAVSYTNVACRLLDLDSVRCRHYAQRRRYVPGCVTLTPDAVARYDWLPSTCAYRLIGEGKDLPAWHPLVSGDPASVHRAGISVRGRAVSEYEAGPHEHHLVDWPE